jgi:hypothetical protein
MTLSELRQRVIIISGLCEKLFSDVDELITEVKNEYDETKKEILKARICELGNRLHKYENDLIGLKGQLVTHMQV